MITRSHPHAASGGLVSAAAVVPRVQRRYGGARSSRSGVRFAFRSVGVYHTGGGYGGDYNGALL